MNPVFKHITEKENAAVWIADRLRPARVLRLERGGQFPYASFAATLEDACFERTDYVSEPGQFSFMDGSVEIFPFGSQSPFLVSLEGETVASITAFNSLSDEVAVEGDFLEILRKNASSVSGDVDRSVAYLTGILYGAVKDGTTSLLRYPRGVREGLLLGGRPLVEAALLLRGAEKAARMSSGEDILRYGNKLEDWLEKWAFLSGFWSDDPERDAQNAGLFGRRFAHSVVYRDGDTVLKLKQMIPDPVLFIDNIAVFNTLFPDMKMVVERFGRNRHGDLCAVIRQQAVAGRAGTPEEIRTALRQAGLRKATDRDADGFIGRDVFVEGADEGDAFTGSDGRVRLVSCRAGLDIPERRRGGLWRIPEPEGTPDCVEEVRTALETVLPLEVGREDFISGNETRTNMLSSQFEVTGRFDGYFTEWDFEKNEERQFAACVDPFNKGIVLKIYCENIRMLIEDDETIPEKERDEICYGFGMWIGGVFTSFGIPGGHLVGSLPFLDTLRQNLFDEESEMILQGLADKKEQAEKKTSGRRKKA